jgi:hypothetical protein
MKVRKVLFYNEGEKGSLLHCYILHTYMHVGSLDIFWLYRYADGY